MAETAVPQSRSEAILRAKINGEEYSGLPQSRIERLLLELDTGGGGGGGTNDYNKLINRPYSHTGRPLEGDISDEIDESTQDMTVEQMNKIKGYLNDNF